MPISPFFTRYRAPGTLPASDFSEAQYPSAGQALSGDEGDYGDTPLQDQSPDDTPDTAFYDSPVTTDQAQQVQQQAAVPSNESAAMAPAGKVPPIGVQPQGPPLPPPGAQGAPTPPAPDPNSPQGLLSKYAGLRAPVLGVDPVTGQKKPPNILQKIGQAALSATRLGPEGAAAIMHPNYQQQVGQYNATKADLANQIKLADQVEQTEGQAEARKTSAAARAQAALDTAVKNGITLQPHGSPPKPGLLSIGQSPLYPGQDLYQDPHFGEFMVTPKQAELTNGVLEAGSWAKLATLNDLVKGGIDQGKPTKESTVPVSVATARAMDIQTAPNANGTVDVPQAMALKKYELDNSPDKAQKNLVPADVLLHPQDFTPDQVKKAQELFDKEHRPPRENDNAATSALDRETARFAKPHDKAFADANTQLEKINDAQQMVQGGAIDQALGVPKVMTALISGAGSGVRITQAELSAIAHARGIAGDAEGTIRSWLGQGKLTRQQQQSLNGILSDVKQRVIRKAQIAKDAADEINSAPDRPSIIAADKKYRQMVMDMETNPQGQGAGASQLPPQAVAQLKEGHDTTFANGQVWRLTKGKPERIK